MDGMAVAADQGYCITTYRNHSLSAAGRRVALGIMAANTLGLALGFTVWFGAWPILPYSGLEVLGLWLGFRWIAQFDGDYERLTIDDHLVTFERCHRGIREQIQSNRQWVQLTCRIRGSQCSVALRSHGREFPIARLMTDESRLELVDALIGKLRIIRISS